MPSEIRYFRSDTHTINGLLAYQLKATNTNSVLVVFVCTLRIYIGIRVWKRSSAGVETEITGGSAVAIASLIAGSSGYFERSATWVCPTTSLASTDAIVVRVYGDPTTPPTTLVREFITEQLTASQLDASTWTVYYWIHRIRDWDDEYERWVYFYYFMHGSDTYNSRITNFNWTTGIAPFVPQLFIDGLVMIQT